MESAGVFDIPQYNSRRRGKQTKIPPSAKTTQQQASRGVVAQNGPPAASSSPGASPLVPMSSKQVNPLGESPITKRAQMPSAAEIAVYRSDDGGDDRNEHDATVSGNSAQESTELLKNEAHSPSKRRGSGGLRPSLSKREEIRKRLREKEKQLSKMISSRSNNNNNNNRDISPMTPSSRNSDRSGFALESPVPRRGERVIQTVGKDEADRREAIRILSSAALKMKETLKKQRQKTKQLQDDFRILKVSLNGKENDKSKLEQELQKLRDEHEESQRRLLELHRSNDETKMKLSESALDETNEIHLQSQLAAAHEEVSWTQKDSKSKAEQIEYFEYQLLSKNNEIDDLRQALNKNSRRIVELEVDLEIHDDRYVSSMDMFSRVGSLSGTITSAPSSTGDTARTPVIVDATEALNHQQQQQQKKRRSLVQVITGSLRRKGSKQSSRSIASQNVSEGSASTISQFQIDKMQADISKLEARYKKEKLQSRMQIEQLKQDNNDYLMKVVSLEKSLQNQDTGDEELQLAMGSHSADEKDALPNKSHFLKERVEKLESGRELDGRTIETLRAHIARLEGDIQHRDESEEQELKQLKLENQVKEAKLRAVQRDLGEATQKSDRSLNGLHVNAAAGLEAKLQDNVAEIVRLRMEQEVKDKKIETLRSEIIELRLLRMQYEKADHDSMKHEESDRPLEAIKEMEPAAGETMRES